MYIVCAPQQQVDEIINLLDEINRESYALPLVDFHFDPDKLKYFAENINNFDYIMLSSPSVIKVSGEIISTAIMTKFITVGIKSADELRKYTANEIIYPKKSSGREALLNECLQSRNFANKKVLIIKGEDGENDGYLSFSQVYLSWLKLELYSKIPLGVNVEELKNLLFNSSVQGIILTTSSLVADLFAVAAKINCEKLLQKKLFIVLHQKIANKLHEYDVSRILLTKSAAKEDIIDVVRML